MPLANVSWFAPQPVRPDMRAALRSQAAADTKDVGFAPEPYAFGKQACRACGGGGVLPARWRLGHLCGFA